MKNRPDFDDWRGLLSTSPVQLSARSALEDAGVFMEIANFSPLLCGSIPLDLAIDISDIDISCHAPNLEEYIYFALDQFKSRENFYLKIKEIRQEPSVIVRFTHKGMLIELFTQKIPVHEQNGYLHMVTEWHILNEESADFRSRLMELRKRGIKTEPAFAELLGLDGDPYLGLLDYGRSKGFI